MDKDFDKDFERKLTSALDGAAPEEAEALLRGIGESTAEWPDELAARRIRNAVLAKCGAADAAAAENKPAARKKAGRIGWKKLVAAACAVLLLAGIGFGARAYAKEAKEYKTAVGFFEDNALPTEGLSREEIKAVYNDMNSKSYSNPKTVEVLRMSLSKKGVPAELLNTSETAVSPSEIGQLASMNAVYQGIEYTVEASAGDSRVYDGCIHYERDYRRVEYEGYTMDVIEKAVFAKYSGDAEQPLWEVELPRAWIANYAPVEGGVLVTGYTDVTTADSVGFLRWPEDADEAERVRQRFIAEELSKYTDDTEKCFIAKIADDGTVVFKTFFEIPEIDPFTVKLYGCFPLEAPDGSPAIILPGMSAPRYFDPDNQAPRDTTAFSLIRFTPQGDYVDCITAAYGDYVLCAAAKAEDGYVAVLTKFMPFASSSILTAENEPMIVHISADGEITPIAGCEAPYSTFRVSSIAEYGGKIYISGYEFTGAKNGAFLDERSEIIPLLDELFADMETIMDPETGESTISSDMLTPRVAEIYTGKLLAIVPGSGTVEEVLSLDGAIGSTLSFTHEGKLLWNCESFASTFDSPATSSFTIGGLCRVGQCVIEPGGSVDGGVFLIGAIVIYRR